MKKVFIVRVDYEELPENSKQMADVFYDTALEVAVEELMEGYKSTSSIVGDYSVNVRQIW